MKNIILFILIVAFQISLGQKDHREVQFFFAFDTIRGILNTDKILFNKTNALDTVKSKPYLDSLVWCFINNPTTIIEINLTKGHDILEGYRGSEIRRKQAKSIANYLILIKKIPAGRVVVNAIHCGELLVKEEDLKSIEQKKKDVTIRTNIRILSKDYRPK